MGARPKIRNGNAQIFRPLRPRTANCAVPGRQPGARASFGLKRRAWEMEFESARGRRSWPEAGPVARPEKEEQGRAGWVLSRRPSVEVPTVHRRITAHFAIGRKGREPLTRPPPAAPAFASVRALRNCRWEEEKQDKWSCMAFHCTRHNWPVPRLAKDDRQTLSTKDKVQSS